MESLGVMESPRRPEEPEIPSTSGAQGGKRPAMLVVYSPINRKIHHPWFRGTGVHSRQSVF